VSQVRDVGAHHSRGRSQHLGRGQRRRRRRRRTAIEVRLRVVRNVEARRWRRLQLICWNVVLLTSHHLILRSKSGLSWLVAVGGSSNMKHRDCLALVVTRLDTPELRLRGQDVVGRLDHYLVVLGKIEIPDMLGSGKLCSVWSRVLVLISIVEIEVCKFTLGNRISPHVGRRYAKVHFFVTISFIKKENSPGGFASGHLRSTRVTFLQH